MNAKPNTKTWVVIGAGPQGVHMVCSLLEAGYEADQIALIDRFPKPLHLWNQQTSRLEMDTLRSTAVHHLDVGPWALREFATAAYGHRENWSSPPYDRPQYHVFQAHCEKVMRDRGIQRCFEQDSVRAVREVTGGYQIITESQSVLCKNLVLALGQAPLLIPAWAKTCDRAQHILSPNFSLKTGPTIVLGGGMTGVQFSLAQCEKVDGVTLVAPRLPGISDFDADPCWIGPKCLTPRFHGLGNIEKRLEIRQARRPGTINPQVSEAFKRATASGQIKVRLARAEGLENDKLRLSNGELLDFSQLVLATGFEKRRPGGELVDQLIEDLKLPLSPCGFPELPHNLEWRRGLFVMGGLAELILGPVARNITGGRSAS